MNEMIKLMHLAEEYDVFIEFNSHSMIVRKYGDIDGRPFKYNMSFAPGFIEEFGVEKCLDVFENRCDKYIEDLKSEE